MMGNYHVRFGKSFLVNDKDLVIKYIIKLLLGLISYFTLIIAVPTGIKIFSWLSFSFSKRNLTKNNLGIINNLYSQGIYKYRLSQGRKFGVRYFSTGNQHSKPDSIFIDLINESIFNILVFKSNKHKLGEGVALSFTINCKDKILLDKLYNMLGRCGKIVQRKNYLCLIIKDIKSINEKVIPFLENFNLNNKKLVEFKS